MAILLCHWAQPLTGPLTGQILFASELVGEILPEGQVSVFIILALSALQLPQGGGCPPFLTSQ